MDARLLLNILAVFAPLSFLSVGGGQAIVSDIHRQSVEVYGWMNNGQFLDLYALSRITPGPGALLATLVGWQTAGILGALVASFAIFVPSSVLVFALAHVWARYKQTACIRAIEAGLVPVAAGMILATSFIILQAAEGGWLAWIIAAVSTLALALTRVSPFLMLGLGAAVFLVALH